MAIVWMDGPDHYGTNGALLTQGVYGDAKVSLVANSGPGGVGHTFLFSTNANGGILRKVLPGERTLVGAGTRFYKGYLPSGNRVTCLFTFRDIFNQDIGALYVISTGALQYVRYPDNVVLVTTDPVITAQSWRHIECRVEFGSGTGGSLAIGVDSVTIVDIDSINTGASPCAQVCQGPHGYAGGNECYTRDFYLWDATGDYNNSGMQGDRQVITSFPTADGPEDDWAPSVGTHGWSILKNNPPDDGVYVSADAAEDLSNFETDDIDTDITSISACMLVGRFAKSDAGLGTIKMTFDSEGDVSPATEKALSTEFTYYSQIVERDPHTDLKWTPFGVNNALAQIERIQ